jgi:hypothetical protein
MKRTLSFLIALLAMSLCASAGKNPTDYPLTAHVLGTSKVPVGVGLNSTGGLIMTPETTSTELRIGNMVYAIGKTCKNVEIGKDYPARVDKKVHLLLPGGKTCNAGITGTHEVPATP